MLAALLQSQVSMGSGLQKLQVKSQSLHCSARGKSVFYLVLYIFFHIPRGIVHCCCAQLGRAGMAVLVLTFLPIPLSLVAKSPVIVIYLVWPIIPTKKAGIVTSKKLQTACPCYKFILKFIWGREGRLWDGVIRVLEKAKRIYYLNGLDTPHWHNTIIEKRDFQQPCYQGHTACTPIKRSD